MIDKTSSKDFKLHVWFCVSCTSNHKFKKIKEYQNLITSYCIIRCFSLIEQRADDSILLVSLSVIKCKESSLVSRHMHVFVDFVHRTTGCRDNRFQVS